MATVLFRLFHRFWNEIESDRSAETEQQFIANVAISNGNSGVSGCWAEGRGGGGRRGKERKRNKQIIRCVMNNSTAGAAK